MTAIQDPVRRVAPGPAARTAAAHRPATGPGWSRVLVVSGSRAALAAVLSLVLWAVLPAALGWTPRVVMSGSMMPRLEVGDVVVDRPVDPSALTDGRIITVRDPDHPGTTRTHRFIERDEAGRLVTRGDANDAVDSTPVDPDDLLGAAVLRVPHVGLPVTWVSQGRLAPVGIGLTVLLLLCLAASTPLRLGPAPDEAGDDRPDRPGRPGRPGPEKDAGLDILGARSASRPAPRPEQRGGVHRTGRRPPRAGLRATALGSVVLVLVCAPTTGAAFSAPTSNPASAFAAAASFHPYRDRVLLDRPSVYWRLDETGGTTAASSVTPGVAGAAQGTVSWGQAGALASERTTTAAGFGGGYVAAGLVSTATTQFTLETWVRTSYSQGGALVSLGSAGVLLPSSVVDRVLYLGPDGRARAGVASTGTLTTARDVVVSQTTVNDGAWHHVVATYDAASGLRLYVDGDLQGSKTATYAVQPGLGWYRAAGDGLTGWPGAPTATTFTGQLDEVAVYDRALTAAEVAQHHTVAVQP